MSHEQEACWTLSNIVAGTSPQMASVCDSPGLLGGVIELLSGDVWEVQKEANFVISNVATASDGERTYARAPGSSAACLFRLTFIGVCASNLIGAVKHVMKCASRSRLNLMTLLLFSFHVVSKAHRQRPSVMRCFRG